MDLIAAARRLDMGEFMNTDTTVMGSAYGSYDWDADLARRLELALPGDSVRGMFANGLLGAVRTLAGDEAVRRCLQASGQSQFVDFFNYPIGTHLQVVFTAARMLAPKLGSIEEAMRQLGRCSTAIFMSSAAGKTMKLLAGGDPKRLLGTLPAAYRVSMTFGRQTLEWTSPTSGRYLLKRDFIPLPCHEGVLQALLEMTSAQDVKVHGRQTTGLLDGEYEFSWH